MLKEAVFLDRDRVINENDEGEYILHWDQFRFIPGVMKAMFKLYASKYEVFVVSNQSGIGRKMEYDGEVVTQTQIYCIFRKMEETIVSAINSSLLCNAGVPGEPQLALSPSHGKARGDMSVPRVIRDISFCPHLPNAGCCCRKPKPGMIYALAYKYGINLAKSWMIGDKNSDMKAGYNAGIRRLIRIVDQEYSYLPGTMSWPLFRFKEKPRLPSLLNAVSFIEDHDKWGE